MEANIDRGCGLGCGPRADWAWVPSFGGDSGAFSEHEMTHIFEIARKNQLESKTDYYLVYAPTCPQNMRTVRNPVTMCH